MFVVPKVFVVDDDEEVRNALHCLLEYAGFNTVVYPDPQTFLNHYCSEQPGCLVLDVRMPGMSGLSLQEKLRKQKVTLPVIMLTGHGDVPVAVRAFKQGAVDFMEKPFDNEVFLASVRRALEMDSSERSRQARQREVDERLELLTARERDVLHEMMAGHPHKVIANMLNISLSSMEAHRKRIMEKLQVEDLSALIRLVGVASPTATGQRSTSV